MSEPCPTCGHVPPQQASTEEVVEWMRKKNETVRAQAVARALRPRQKTPLQMRSEADGLEVQARLLRIRADRLDRDQ